MTIHTLRSEQPKKLIEESHIIDGHRKLDVPRMAIAGPGALATSSAARNHQLVRKSSTEIDPMHLHMIAPCTKRRVVKSTGNRIVKRIECRGIANPLHGDSFDLLAGQDTEIDACNRGSNRLRKGCHVRMPQLASPEHVGLL